MPPADGQDVVQGKSTFSRSWKTKKVENEKGPDHNSCQQSITRSRRTSLVATDGGEDAYVLVNRCFHVPCYDPVSLTLR